MSKETELRKILTEIYRGQKENNDEAVERILLLFSVSEQLPPNPTTDKEHKKLMKALYPKDKSKSFRR